MSVLGKIVYKLLPRDEIFYDVLSDLAEVSGKSFDAFHRFVNLANEGKFDTELRNEINHYRTVSKKSCESFSRTLARSFITPFDREDMLEFANILYRNIKLIDKIANRMYRSQVVDHAEDFSRMLNIIEKQAHLQQDLVKHFNNNNIQQTQTVSEEISGLERQSDELLEQLTILLCEGAIDMREAFARKDIYEMFERLADAYRDAGHMAVQIVLKHN